MNKNSLHKLVVCGFIFAVLTTAVFLLLLLQPDVLAGSDDTVYGRAWSENIGWINFNCTNFDSCGNVNYGVTIASAGNISGRAWSEHIGWISFDQTSGCPTAPCQANRNPKSGELVGWARACAGTLSGDCLGPNADGWDGWIHLKGPGYGVLAHGCEWRGRAWGSRVIGWINFYGIAYGVKERMESCLPLPATPPPPPPPTPSPEPSPPAPSPNQPNATSTNNGAASPLKFRETVP